MNIAVLHYHRIGGSGIIAYEVGRSLVQRYNIHAHFVGNETPFRLFEQEEDNIYFHKIWVKEYPVFDFQPYTLALASQLSDIIDRFDIDIIHSHYALPHAVAAILAREIAKKKVKCVTTLHGTDITVVGSHPTMKNITRYAITSSDAVTAVSRYLVEESEKIFTIPPGQIRTIYNFVNPHHFYPCERKQVWCDKKKCRYTLIHLSNLREVKSPMDVIAIFHRLRNFKSLDVELWIVGEGPLEIEMREEVNRLGLTEWVQFLGMRTQVAPILAAADLMLLTSRTESFGLATLEAMACGTPTLARRVGGLPEVIEDGVSGLLFEKDSLDDATTQAADLLQSPSRLEAMCQACLRSAKSKFPMNDIIDQYYTLYQQCLETLS